MIKEFNLYGINFIVKDSKQGKRLYVKNLDIPVNPGVKTYKQAYEQGLSILKDKGEVETIKAYKYYIDKKVKERFFNDVRINKLFYDIFKLKLLDFKYRYSVLIGDCLDIIRFDKVIGTPEGISTKDYINRLYGNKAVKLIEKLIK